jgi:hypothetical protein
MEIGTSGKKVVLEGSMNAQLGLMEPADHEKVS